MTQRGDVLHYQTVDGGEINSNNGVVEMTAGLETAVYLSLFGGNEEDDGREANPYTWWGNREETEEEKKYISRTQYLLQSLPATSANLKRLQDAIKLDLEWMTAVGAAMSIEATARIPSLNKIEISVTINGDTTLKFTENWTSSL